MQQLKRRNQRALVRIRRMRDRRRRIVRRYKRMVGCVVCGLHDPHVLDLHHRQPLLKGPRTIQQMISENAAWHRIQAEIRKCVVICANDHRRVHAGVLDLGVHIRKRAYIAGQELT